MSQEPTAPLPEPPQAPETPVKAKERPFHWRLKRAREDADLTQTSAAKLLQVERRTFVRWENGEYSPGYSGEVGALLILRKAKSEAISRQLIAAVEGKQP